MKHAFSRPTVDLKKLVEDQNAFTELIYTSPDEVIKELKERWLDQNLAKVVDLCLEGDIPLPLQNSFKGVLFRQLFTPNYELRLFMDIVHKLNIEPMFLEYYDDKFTSNNPLKHSLGKIHFQETINCNDTTRVQNVNVIDFNKSDGKKIKEVKTFWGETLVDLHHALLESVYPNSSQYLFDASAWFQKRGTSAQYYYYRYLSLFIRNGILFENFSLKGGELKFVLEIFLPAFFQVWETTGKKPIIVALLPMNIQDNVFWTSHPFKCQDFIRAKMSNLQYNSLYGYKHLF